MKTRSPWAGAFSFDYRDPVSRKKDWSYYVQNGVTIEGVNYLLNWGFRSGSQQPLWYLGLIDNSGFSAVSQNDTHAAHPGWGEFSSLFNADRPLWSPDPANGGTITSGTPCVFSIVANGTIRGALIASRQPVGVAPGAILYCTGAMSAGMSVSAGGTLSVTYTGQLREG